MIDEFVKQLSSEKRSQSGAQKSFFPGLNLTNVHLSFKISPSSTFPKYISHYNIINI